MKTSRKPQGNHDEPAENHKTTIGKPLENHKKFKGNILEKSKETT